MNNNKKAAIKTFLSKMGEFAEFVKGEQDGKNTNKKEYEVGYCKPPESGKFKKGQSGNPKGRKKKVYPSTITDAIKYELSQSSAITNSKGIKEKVPANVLLAKAMIKDALLKDGNSRKFLFQTKAFMNADVINFSKKFEKMVNQNDESNSASKEEREQICKFLYEVIEYIYKNENPLQD